MTTEVLPRRGRARERMLSLARVLFETAVSIEVSAVGSTGLTLGRLGGMKEGMPLRPCMVAKWKDVSQDAIEKILLPAVCDVILGGGVNTSNDFVAQGGDVRVVRSLLAAVRGAAIVYCPDPAANARAYTAPRLKGLQAASKETRRMVAAKGGRGPRKKKT